MMSSNLKDFDKANDQQPLPSLFYNVYERRYRGVNALVRQRRFRKRQQSIVGFANRGSLGQFNNTARLTTLDLFVGEIRNPS